MQLETTIIIVLLLLMYVVVYSYVENKHPRQVARTPVGCKSSDDRGNSLCTCASSICRKRTTLST